LRGQVKKTAKLNATKMNISSFKENIIYNSEFSPKQHLNLLFL